MKQILIVNSAKALNATGATPLDLSGLEKGAITFFELGATTALAAAPTKNFGIALGMGGNVPAFVIPEVDVNTLTVTKSAYEAGAAWVATITIPTPTAGNNYTLVLVENGVGFNQRSNHTATHFIPVGATMTAAQLAAELHKQFKAKYDAGEINVAPTVSGAAITFTAQEVGKAWTLKAADALAGTTVTVSTEAKKAIGDKAYVEDLAHRCVAGKGMNYLAEDGAELYPAYPEAVEDVHYTIFNLRFATKRDSSHQRDELVWQYVHIAVPETNSSLSTITSILGQPVLVNAAAEAEDEGE